ncbi:hypothetical protein NHF46_11695 [Arthrobacter alpinus]|nr:hypothetical protein [Arthrobacter alpinus]
MKTYEYRTDWVDDNVTSHGATSPIAVLNVTNHLNTHAGDGWEPISIAPAPTPKPTQASSSPCAAKPTTTKLRPAGDRNKKPAGARRLASVSSPRSAPPPSTRTGARIASSSRKFVRPKTTHPLPAAPTQTPRTPLKSKDIIMDTTTVTNRPITHPLRTVASRTTIMLALGLCLAWLAISPLTTLFHDLITAAIAAGAAITASALCAYHAARTWHTRRTTAIMLITTTALIGVALTTILIIGPTLDPLSIPFASINEESLMQTRASAMAAIFASLYTATTAAFFASHTTKNDNHTQ